MSSTEAPAANEVTDATRSAMVATLQAALGDGFVESHIRSGDDLWVRVTAAAWQDAARVARDQLGCRYFCFLSAIDWMPSPFGRGEDDPTAPPPERSTAIEQGYAGGATRFQMLARYYDVHRHVGLNVKADLDDADPAVASLVPIFAGADWHERETWEMFGIRFLGHPNLVHLYLPGDFEGFPLRKDFPLLARMIKPWPGIVDVEPLPGGDDGGEE